MEIGAPMAALYLLQNPDHYTNHEFKVFYWKNYVNHVESEWQRLLDNEDPEEIGDYAVGGEQLDVGVTRTEQMSNDIDLLQDEEGDEKVQLSKSGNRLVSKTNTDEYRFRPIQHEPLTLYEWVQCSIKHNEQSSRSGSHLLTFFPYHPDHPQHTTHTVAIDADRQYCVVPNFVGPSLPRKDGGDREFYCCTMLTLFMPWRSALDLKSYDQTWEAAFDAYQFSARQKEIMANLNIRYECYDARDDYPAMYKSTKDDENDSDVENETNNANHDIDDMDVEDFEGEFTIGPQCERLEVSNIEARRALHLAGLRQPESATHSLDLFKLPRVALHSNVNAFAWKQLLTAKKQRLWNLKFTSITAKTPGETAHGPVKNDAYILPGSYLTNNFVPVNADWGKVIDGIATEYTLNTEQKKAFKIVANHATCIVPEQLLMYLGGMGGTGKTRVIRALEAYFTRRGEPYRFVLLGPTGTSSALIGGSTYHSFLGVRTGKMTGEPSATIEDVRERLTNVGYIFIDECSMLSCLDLCRISARICEALNVYELPFRGLNLILAGDFAQLPPTSGKGTELFSRAISVHQAPRQSPTEQAKTIGRLIWLQFTTVVVLQENMRQKGTSADEKAFQAALENLRWKACTDKDIALFRSRIAGKEVASSLNKEPFKNVSIITTWNKVKDEFNACNSERFAKECGQDLSEFYSIDKLGESEVTKNRTRTIYSDAKKMSMALRRALWNQPPNTSGQIPACLKLCLGMPVIIRYNVATDLCITRGQEARVVSWTSQLVARGLPQRKLDVLYVELILPPKTIKLPNLPVNVVPLTAIDHYVEARLPSDIVVKVKRVQIPVLPNFAMTDYSSQGKTRPTNVIDIAESRSFHAVYTSLSRGTSLAGTLILWNFANDNLQGGVDGEIRQEYRELDNLSEVTDLVYHGVLPPNFLECTRWATIERWRQWKIQRGESISDIDPYEGEDMSELAKVKAEIHTITALNKRKRGSSIVTPKKKRRQVPERSLLNDAPWLVPVGPVWDPQDYSCAYDALIFVFYWLWVSDRERWSKAMLTYGVLLEELVSKFESTEDEYIVDGITELRSQWRDFTRILYLGQFPAGTMGVNILDLICKMLGVADDMSTDDPLVHFEVRCRYTAPEAYSLQRHFESLGNTFMTDESRTHMGYISDVQPALLCVELVGKANCIIEPRVQFGEFGEYRLVGMVYFGGFHFVTRIVTPDNQVYIHDGMNGAYSTYEGTIGEDFEAEELAFCADRTPSLAIYVAD